MAPAAKDVRFGVKGPVPGLEEAYSKIRVRRRQRMKFLQSVRVRDAKIVAGEYADLCSARKSVFEFILYELQARQLYERGKKIRPVSQP